MSCIKLIRRSSVQCALARRPWTVASTLLRTSITMQQQTRSLITIKKFYRVKDQAPLKKGKPAATATSTDDADAVAAASSENDPTGEEPATDTRSLSKPVRLAKRIALAGVCSRREAEKLIQAHEVLVNGKIVTELGTNVDLEKDAITVQGRSLAKTMRRKVWMANKLPGELVTANDPENRPTIFDRLRVMGLSQHMMPVGRLDFNTEGLLLFTNDGEYARELEHPKTEVVRVYRVLVRGSVTPSKLDELRRGPMVDGVKFRSIHAFVQSTDKKDSWLQVRLAEGKNREVRKALAHIRLVVKRLIRVQYGPYRLADLPTGSVLEVRPKNMVFDKNDASPREKLAKKTTPRSHRSSKQDKLDQDHDDADEEEQEENREEVDEVEEATAKEY